MKYTKNCVYPWTYLLIHAGGLIQTCPCASDIEIGDFILDYCDKKQKGENPDIFNTNALKKIRRGLLTGNLRKMCRGCAFNTAQLITTDELETKVSDIIKERYPDWNYSGNIEELTDMYAYKQMGLGLSNRCNLRCIYCNQSVCADTNPFYKAEFPEKYAQMSLEALAATGITSLIPSVEGEITLYPHWYKVYSEFHRKHPGIALTITTNLNRIYSDEEIELLTQHDILDISCDTLDEKLYSKLRVNGKLDMLLQNLSKIKEKAIENGRWDHIIITIHVVLCDLTWRSLEDVSNFAFENGYGLNIGNYEERANARAYREKLLKPVYSLSWEEQKEIESVLIKIREKAASIGANITMHGDILYRVKKNIENNYNKFMPAASPIYEKFIEKYPNGEPKMYLDIVYDHDNISYAGIAFEEDTILELQCLQQIAYIICRFVSVYREGKASAKYGQNVLPGYRFKEYLENGVLRIPVQLNNPDLEKVVLVIEEII